MKIATTCAASVAASMAGAQIEFTEVMHNPVGADSLWEWVEIRNTSAAPVDLNGWVLDDDDDSSFGQANIVAAAGRNTVVPAQGVAVLYPGDSLGFDPMRFTNAWGGGIPLIGVDGFTRLAALDAIGLWPSHAGYLADAIPMSTTSPRRTFASAAASLNYTSGFPSAGAGRSIAWSGSGSVASGANWVVSEEGGLGAVVSSQTVFAAVAINSVEDRGNPGALPAGPATAGLRISEIMFAPASPAVTAGYSAQDFEWIEVFNNTASAINFAATPHVLDDVAGSQLSAANIRMGTLASGQVGVLFNSARISEADMATMWGAGINYIPVTNWPALNNNGDTIALWGSTNAYDSEPVTGPGRTQQNALVAVTYDTLAGAGWPTVNNMSSIYLSDLSGDASLGASWTRAGANGEPVVSRNPAALVRAAIDHPGGDVGSPGYAPGSVVAPVAGDYNQNGVVDAADYTVWRNQLGAATLPNRSAGITGPVGTGDYNIWKSRFGFTSGSGSLSGSQVPEPRGVLLLFFGLVGPARRRWRPALR